jgi:hypothetical protein
VSAIRGVRITFDYDRGEEGDAEVRALTDAIYVVLLEHGVKATGMQEWTGNPEDKPDV